MKKLLTAIFLLFIFSSQAQSPGAIKLQQQILQHPQQDTVRVNRLNDLSLRTSISLGARDSAASEALAIAKKLDYSEGKINALMNLSMIKAQHGETQEAMSLLKQAFIVAEAENDKENQVSVLWSIATLKMKTDDTKTAIDDYLKAEAIAEDLHDKKWLASNQRAIGGFYSTVTNLPLAMEWVLKSMKTAEEANCTSCLESSWMSLGNIYGLLGDQEKALLYFQKVMDANKSEGKATSSSLFGYIGERYRLMGKYPEAIKSYKEALALDRDPFNTELYESNLADVYVRMDSLTLGFQYAFSSLKGAEKLKDVTGIAWIDGILARAYLKKSQPDSALYYAKKGLSIATEVSALEFMRDNSEALANAYLQKKDFENAYRYNTLFITYRDSMLNENVSNQANLLQYNYNKEKTEAQISTLNQQKKNQRNFLIAALVFLGLIILTALSLLRNNRQKQKANTLLRSQKKEIDAKAKELSVQKEHLQQSYNNVELLGDIGRKITSSLSVEKIISTAYNNVNRLMDAAIFGIGIYNDNLKTIDFPATYEKGKALSPYTNSVNDKNRFASVCLCENKEIVMGNLNEEYKDHVQEVATPREGELPASLIFLPLVIKEKKMGVVTVQSFQKNAYSDYHLFMLRNIAIYTAIALENADSFNTLNHTLLSLKSAQSQLIQSEKMASLGELTAGIAHEIQNPLNFVNNFSDLNQELIGEMKNELANGNEQEAMSLADDIKENEKKINHHGKRADAIVKGMLQHSRNRTGQKELTDINALADEYLRLSYHGLRAKDKTFNANMKTNFDESIGKINVIPQDIGRVLLNLFNNAFYAVKPPGPLKGEYYQPTVSVSTKKIDGHISIHVKDNGNGIPQKSLDKIFQPFFTTKPTGEGTGLGLSLSYDIIKAHGGALEVESKENEGTEFVIQLPAV